MSHKRQRGKSADLRGGSFARNMALSAPGGDVDIPMIFRSNARVQSQSFQSFALAVSFLFLSPSAGMGAPTASVSTSSKTIKMNKGWVRQIRNAQKHGVEVFYPDFMPSRFKLTNMKFGGYDKAHPDYSLIFEAKGKRSITIESAYEGIGDGPDGYKKLKGRSKIFGRFAVNVFKPRTEGNDTDEYYYLSDWLESRKKVKPDAKRFYNLYGTGVKEKEVIAILESLAPLKK